MTTTRLTFKEFKKAIDAGMITGQACGCIGPQGDDQYCPCSMSVLNMIVDKDKPKLIEHWRANGYYSKDEREAKWKEKQAENAEQNFSHMDALASGNRRPREENIIEDVDDDFMKIFSR